MEYKFGKITGGFIGDIAIIHVGLVIGLGSNCYCLNANVGGAVDVISFMV